MTETEPLQKAILLLAETEAAQVEKEAEREAEALLQRARENARIGCQKARGEAELAYIGLVQKAQRQAQHEQALLLLAAKNEGIERVFEKALSRTVQHPGYAEALERGILAEAVPGKAGQMVLTEADNAQLPEEFWRRVGDALLEKGASISPAGRTLQEGGGFVLVYDTEEKNRTLPALLQTLREALTQQVAAVLYGEEET